MAERPLRDVLVDEPPRRGVPVWIWGCGGGCLVLVLLAVVATIWMQRLMTRATGPEAAWPIIDSIAPFDAQPPELEAFRSDARAPLDELGVDTVPEGMPAEIAVGFRRSRDGLMVLFHIGEDPPLSLALALVDEGASTETAELQGRAVELRRFRVRDQDMTLRRSGFVREHDAVAFELGERDGEPVRVVAQWVEGEITLERVVDVLAPFDLWARGAPASEPATTPAPGDEGR